MIDIIEGVIVEVNGDSAQVMLKNHSECSLCGSCQGDNALIFCAYNQIGAELGQTVIVKVERNNTLKAAFIMFIIPILAILIGVIVGEIASDFFGFSSNFSDIILGFTFFSMSIVAIFFYDGRLKQRSTQPIIKEIVK